MLLWDFRWNGVIIRFLINARSMLAGSTDSIEQNLLGVCIQYSSMDSQKFLSYVPKNCPRTIFFRVFILWDKNFYLSIIFILGQKFSILPI